jgi:hypothetical protein
MAKAEVSKMFAGITQAASEDAQKKFRMGSLIHSSSDDTSSNPLSAADLALISSPTKMQFNQVVGNVRNFSGGNSRYANNAKSQAFYLNNITSFQNAFGLASIYGADNKTPKEIFSTMKRMASEQTRMLTNSFQETTSKSYEEAIDLASKGINVDGRKDADTRAIFNIQEGSDPQSQDVLFASVAYTTILGLSGPGVLTIGGCDYHDGTQETGDNKDLQIGQLIGRVVELAHRKQKPLFIQIVTDGGVDAVEGSRKWRGDSGARGMSVIGYFDPNQIPSYAKGNNSIQIGHYNSSQAADTSTLIGASPSKAAYAAFANYLHICGRLGEFNNFAPGIFARDEMDSILVFAGGAR